MPVDAPTLRSQVLALLTGQLGIYTYPGGQTTPALWVEDGTQNIQPKATGLECVIRVFAEDEYTNYLSGDYGSKYTHQITLKQWNIAATTLAAKEALKALPYVLELRPRVVRNEIVDNIETQAILVMDWA